MSTAFPREGIQLIVGLGNPGPRYANTRHNVGFWLIEKLCEIHNVALLPESKLKSCLATLTLANRSCRILQPLTYMNRSGEALGQTVRFFNIPANAILVIHDELDLPAGTARLKWDGGHGGHNGLRNIITHLNTKQFFRLRIGIGHPGDKEEVLNYVLHPPSRYEQGKILSAIEETLCVLPAIVEGQLEKAMNQLHAATK